MTDPSAICVLMVTAAPAEAERIVDALVQERLIACGNIVAGVRSVYRWEGKVCRDEEALIIMETPVAQRAAAIARLHALHSYDTPKIIELSPASVDGGYLRWVHQVTTGEG